MESGYYCANPNCRNVITLEIHHIVPVKDDGSNEPDNLIALCPYCHELHTKDFIPAEAIETWKSMLVSLNSTQRTTVDLLLLLYRQDTRTVEKSSKGETAQKFRFTGDGLAALAGLINVNIVEISKRHDQVAWAGGLPSFEVSFTEKGRQLVEAWIKGKPEAVREALSATET